MRKIVLAFTALGLIAVSCSKDDDAKSNCESCVYNGETIEICPSGDDEYTVTAGPLKDTVTKAELDAFELTPKEYVLLLCAAGDITLD